MEEDLMLPLLDLAELELNAGVSIGSIVGIDPKLGGFGDFRSFDRWKERSNLLATTVPSSDASKRARASPSNGNGRRIVSCLVEGCLSDLSKCREYNRRHKVCEAHSKTAVVMVDGRLQRFCQQCSRFHLLVEFDEVKRSCRRKLDGHNKRRRKPQPRLDKGRAESLITNQQGSEAGFYLYPRMFPAAAPEFMVAGTVESKEIALCPNPHLIDRKRNFHGKRFPFLQDSDDALSSSSFAFGSDCAPSLLSSSSEASCVEIGGQMAPADSIPIGQPMIAGLQAGFNCSVTEDGYMSAVFDTDLHCQGLHVHGKSRGHPFSW